MRYTIEIFSESFLPREPLMTCAATAENCKMGAIPLHIYRVQDNIVFKR